jgi:cell division protein FtsZ
MSINIGLPHLDGLKPRIAVIGVGGAGGNAIANMMTAHVEGVDFMVANTDAQALGASTAERRIQLGAHITQGLGAGSRPEVGRAAAEESISDLEQALDGMHMVFIAAGMGGGTGTGAAPVIAKAAREKGILTVGVVTKPFNFEGTRRMRSADAGIEELQQHVDTLIVIPNQNLFLVAEANTTFKDAFRMADEVLQQGVRGITDLMVMPGLVNLDFADVKSVMRDAGKAMMGTGEAEGDGRALAAAQKAIANPLLDGVSMAGAKGVIISITGGEDMGLLELEEAGNHIRELVDPDANIIWGSAFNEELRGKIRVSVVATGLELGQGGGGAVTQPVARPFNFQTRSAAPTPAPAPVVAAPIAAPASAWTIIPPATTDSDLEDIEPLNLETTSDDNAAPGFATLDDEATVASDAQSAEHSVGGGSDASDAGDELVLEAPDALDAAVEAEVADTPIVATGVDAPAAPRVAPGATLFERLSRMRGDPDTSGDDDGSGGGLPSMPRFLDRQGNQ